jgi:hypothetical protein
MLGNFNVQKIIGEIDVNLYEMESFGTFFQCMYLVEMLWYVTLKYMPKVLRFAFSNARKHKIN